MDGITPSKEVEATTERQLGAKVPFKNKFKKHLKDKKEKEEPKDEKKFPFKK